MNLKIFFVFVFSLFSSLLIFGQEKGLSKKNVSPVILKHLDTKYPKVTHLKFFQETVNDSLFIESEFKFQKDMYSLKFYHDSLVEVERLVNFNEIPIHIQTLIKKSLDSMFIKYTILESQEVNPETNSLYEINVKASDGKTKTFYECYFDKEGQFIKKIEIALKPIPSLF